MISDLDWFAKTCVITLLGSSIYLWNVHAGHLAQNKSIEKTSVNVYIMDYTNGPYKWTMCTSVIDHI